MDTPDFVVIGSGGGGGTISWLLAKAGYSVLVLEQGSNFEKPLDDDHLQFNQASHDEYRFRLERPDPKRRLRGDYNTFRSSEIVASTPFNGGWTGSVLGGGSVLWGTWSYRALPIDFRLRTVFTDLEQIEFLDKAQYAVQDWPISYSDMEPYYNVAEALYSVCGDREATMSSIEKSEWFQAFSARKFFRDLGQWRPPLDYPSPPYPETPVGYFVSRGISWAGGQQARLPAGIVNPSIGTYSTQEKIGEAVGRWGDGTIPGFWDRPASELWSERVRDACNLCGFCGEYLCWGSRSPKSGTWGSTLKELRDLRDVAEIRTDSKVYELVYDQRLRRATGARYL